MERGKAADFNGAGHKDYRALTDRLSALTAGNAQIEFVDAHRGGEHELVHEDLANPVHLHLRGTGKLTRPNARNSHGC